MLDRITRNKIDEYSELMAEILAGNGQFADDSGFPTNSVTFTPREDWAYLQGYRAITNLELQFLGTRRLINRLKRQLTERGLTGIETKRQIFQFWVYYWQMMEASAMDFGFNSAPHRMAKNRLRFSRAKLEKLNDALKSQ